MNIEWLDFTDDGERDAYIWFNSYVSRLEGSSVHIFDAKQKDGTYKNVLHLALCLNRNIVEISKSSNASRPIIDVIDDQICRDIPGQKTHYKVLLTNNGHEFIRD